MRPRGIYRCAEYPLLRFAVKWDGKSNTELPLETEWIQANDQLIYPSFVDFDWTVWPEENSEAGWRQWLDFQISQTKKGDEANKPARDGATWHSSVEQAIWVVNEWGNHGSLKLTSLDVKTRIRDLSVCEALMTIRRMLFDPSRIAATDHEPPATGGNEQGEGADKSRAEILQSLSIVVRKAYLAYELVESTIGRRLEDRAAYDYLHENGLPDNAGDLGELSDYELPAFDTWARYVREARQALGEQKYNRRAGRQRGRSIATTDEVERWERDQ